MRAGLEQAVDVVDLAGVGGLALVVVAGVEVHGVERVHERRRLVHVVPDPRDPVVGVELHEGAPPVPGRGLAEVGEHAVARVLLALARPDGRVVDAPVGLLHEEGALQPVLVHPPSRLLLGMGVHDRHQAEALLAKVRDHPLRVGEAQLVPGEGVELIQVVDVQPQRVGGDPPLPEAVGDEADLGLRIVAIAALVEAEGPARRQRHAARQVRVALDDPLRRGPVDEVVVELPVLGPEGQAVGGLVAHVEGAAERVVEQDAVGAALAQHHVEGDRDVERVGVVGVVVGVGRPHDEGGAAHVRPALGDPAVLLSKTVDVLVRAQRLPDLDLVAREGDPALRVVLVEDVALGVGHRDAERVVADRRLEGGGGDRRLGGADLDRRAGSAQVVAHHRVGVVAAEGLGRGEPHPQDVGGHRAHGDDPLGVLEDQGVSVPLRRRHRAERRPARLGGPGPAEPRHGQRQSHASHVPSWQLGIRCGILR